jgi:signal peptidase I
MAHGLIQPREMELRSSFDVLRSTGRKASPMMLTRRASVLVGGPFILLPLIVMLARSMLVVVTVQNKSMSPTLEPGDRLLVVRHWPKRLLRRGYIVIIWPWDLPPTRPRPFGIDTPFIKRIIGLPGDTLVTSLSELDDFHRAREFAAHDSQGQRMWHIPPGQIFVRGDHPIGGFDSLSWGPIRCQSVLGLVMARLPCEEGINPYPASRPSADTSQATVR